MEHTQLIILDEMSMIGRQMMGRIDSRLTQGKAGRIYSMFDEVIILTTCHRLKTIDNPITAEEKAYNDREELFLKVLHRLRDLQWTIDDYLWLCHRKKSQLSAAEKFRFKYAPIIMDFRRETSTNPENNCDHFNRSHLRAHAREHKVPVARFPAIHEGISQDEGLLLDDKHFNDLSSYLEIADDARILLTANLNVDHGLINGAQGTIVAIVYQDNHHPNHEHLRHRMPQYLIVNFPNYSGPSFWDAHQYPERKTWIPLLQRTISDATNSAITRTQFPITLAWALTPWKAQGMTLDLAVVRLGSAASNPGVAFVTLSRVRHPDDLMLDDDFPAMSTIMRQADSDSFLQRQEWERHARVKFSKTIRQHMRDPTVYTPAKCWTNEESFLADVILQHLHNAPQSSDEDLLQSLIDNTPHDCNDISSVWNKMQSFPHVFEIAAARRQLQNYKLDGTLFTKSARVTQIKTVDLYNWQVQMTDIEDFIHKMVVTSSLMELFAKIARSKLPSHCTLHPIYKCKKLNQLPLQVTPGHQHAFIFESHTSHHWALALLNCDNTTTQMQPTLSVWLPHGVDPSAWESSIQYNTALLSPLLTHSPIPKKNKVQ